MNVDFFLCILAMEEAMKKLFSLLFVAAFALTACGGKSTQVPGGEPFVISEPGKTLEVVAANDFKIIIESNPTTGYHWELVGELDKTVVDFVGRDYKSTSDPGLVGGGGVDIWTFRAVAAGEASITLGYYPPSNDPVDPDQTVTFTIIVK